MVFDVSAGGLWEATVFFQCDDDRIASGKIANVGRNSDWVMASFFRLCLPLVRTRHRVSHFEFNSEIPSATHI